MPAATKTSSVLVKSVSQVRLPPSLRHSVSACYVLVSLLCFFHATTNQFRVNPGSFQYFQSLEESASTAEARKALPAPPPPAPPLPASPPPPPETRMKPDSPPLRRAGITPPLETSFDAPFAPSFLLDQSTVFESSSASAFRPVHKVPACSSRPLAPGAASVSVGVGVGGKKGLG